MLDPRPPHNRERMAPSSTDNPLDLLPRWPLAVLVALVLLGLAVVPARWHIGRRAARELIVPGRADTTTLRSLGVPYADLTLRSGDHAIQAWWVRSYTLDSAGPAVLLFHANRSTLSQQAAVQQVLYRAGISSLAFEYSGFGSGAGEPTPAALREDARAAFAAFADSARPAGRRVLLGTSLGAAVLLDAIGDLQTGADAVVLVGAFTSARDMAVHAGRAPRALRFLVPNLYDNVAAVRRLTKPLLIVHSAQDEVVPLDHAERLLQEAAPGAKRLVRLDRGGHATYLSRDTDWQPVIRFIKGGVAAEP